jgi:hypothetical protein
MNIAKICGGEAVGIIMYKTDLAQAIDAMSIALDDVDQKLKKLMSADLRKGVVFHKAALDDILADVRKLQQIAESRRKALPSFTAWARGLPTF